MTDTPENALSSAAEPAPTIWKPALKEAAWTFLAAAVLLIIVYALAFKHIHPEFARFMGQDAEPLTASGKDFIAVSVGKGRKEGSQYIVEDFNGDEAILALPRGFRAEDYPFIKVNLSGFTRYSKAKILWQQAGDPTTHALEFNRNGDEVTQIAMVYGDEAYAGPINSVALLFYDGPALGFENNNDEDIVIKSIEFRPFSAGRVAEQIFEDWTNPPLWQGLSSNVVKGTSGRAMLEPNALTNLVVVASLLVYAARRRLSPTLARKALHESAVATALCICLIGWAFTDLLRWHWRIEQARDVSQRYDHSIIEHKIKANAIRCGRFPEDCKVSLLPHY